MRIKFESCTDTGKKPPFDKFVEIFWYYPTDGPRENMMDDFHRSWNYEKWFANRKMYDYGFCLQSIFYQQRFERSTLRKPKTIKTSIRLDRTEFLCEITEKRSRKKFETPSSRKISADLVWTGNVSQQYGRIRPTQLRCVDKKRRRPPLAVPRALSVGERWCASDVFLARRYRYAEGGKKFQRNRFSGVAVRKNLVRGKKRKKPNLARTGTRTLDP